MLIKGQPRTKLGITKFSFDEKWDSANEGDSVERWVNGNQPKRNVNNVKEV